MLFSADRDDGGLAPHHCSQSPLLGFYTRGGASAEKKKESMLLGALQPIDGFPNDRHAGSF
jgi:hypothetical protein